MRRAAAIFATLGVIVGFRVASPPPADELPLIVVPQGVSAWTFDGERVFLLRDGAVLLSGFLASGPGSGTTLRWCPLSEVFLDVERPSMWDAEGRFVTGEAERDLTAVPVSFDDRLILRVDVAAAEPAAGKTPATVEGIIKARFDAWRAGQLALGTDFCRDAVT